MNTPTPQPAATRSLSDLRRDLDTQKVLLQGLDNKLTSLRELMHHLECQRMPMVDRIADLSIEMGNRVSDPHADDFGGEMSGTFQLAGDVTHDCAAPAPTRSLTASRTWRPASPADRVEYLGRAASLGSIDNDPLVTLRDETSGHEILVDRKLVIDTSTSQLPPDEGVAA